MAELIDLLARIIPKDFIRFFILEQLKKLLKLPILVKKSQELFKEKILLKMILGSEEWDIQIRDLLLKIIRLQSLRQVGMSTTRDFLSASFVEEAISSALSRKINNQEAKNKIVKLLKTKCIDYVSNSDKLEELLESDYFKNQS